MAATKDLERPSRTGDSYGYPAGANIRHFGRTIVAVTATLETVLPDDEDAVAVVGLAEERIDNRDGAAGDQIVRALRGVFLFPVTDAGADDIGKTVYAADDETLQLTNAGGELAAGTIDGIDADGVWVRF
ncbi:hypothetical protein [Afifella pfennigii]|uniref:hypothetical protein n=1 Tax=Afifella pfennigii TaxID=209897 RepID=UPI00047DBC60|nr:hypothetical protein [Afifella pfennigii]